MKTAGLYHNIDELKYAYSPPIKKPHQPRCRVVGLLFSFVDPSFKSFGQDRVYSNLYRNKD